MVEILFSEKIARLDVGINVSVSKSIDRLFGISNEIKSAQSSPFEKKRAENIPLHRICILKLIDDRHCIFLLNLFCKER